MFYDLKQILDSNKSSVCPIGIYSFVQLLQSQISYLSASLFSTFNIKHTSDDFSPPHLPSPPPPLP